MRPPPLLPLRTTFAVGVRRSDTYMDPILRRSQHRTDPTPHPLAAFAVRMTEWCAPIPQALPLWDRVLRLQPTLRDPRLTILPETRRDYPEFPRVVRVLMPRVFVTFSRFLSHHRVGNQLYLWRCDKYKVSFETRVNLLRCR
jgi:hypothetical protein